MKILSSILVGTMLTAGSMASAFDVDLTCSYSSWNLSTDRTDSGDIRFRISDTKMIIEPLNPGLNIKTDVDVSKNSSKTYTSYSSQDAAKGFFYVKETEYDLYPARKSVSTARFSISRLTGKLEGTYSAKKGSGLEVIDGHCSKTQVRF